MENKGNKKEQAPWQTVQPLSGNIAGRPGGGAAARFMRQVEKPKNIKAAALRLWRYFGSEQKALLGILAAVSISCGVALLTPYYLGKAVDVFSPLKLDVNFNVLKTMIFILLAAYLTDAAMNILQGYIMAGVSKRVVVKLRSHLYTKLQKLPIFFFDTHTHGEVMSRLTNDIENVSTTISQSAVQLISGVVTILGTFVMMLLLSPVLTATSLLTVPFVFMLSKTIAAKTKVYFKKQQVCLGALNGYIEEAISGSHIIKAFNHEQKVTETFAELNDNLFKVGLKAQVWSGFLMPLMNVINNLGFVAVAGVGGMLAVKGSVSVGVIAAFLSYSRQFTRPLNDLANIFNTLQSAVAGAERVFETLDEKEEEPDRADAIVLDKPKGDVIFQNVSFGYRPEMTILDHISFEAKAGGSIALVGATGSGKTTIVNLLSRFYDINGGKILIDGRDIRDYSRDSLRKCFGIVLQDTYLFSGTIKENIRYGKLDATDEEVIRAAQMANAHVFISRLEKGYDTVLSQSGNNLSEGQRQLLAIVRAILADTSILILDEATSSVDTRTELNIQKAIMKLMRGHTSFIIAHRLSTIRDVDEIMVIEGGKIIEKGSHEMLMAHKGEYFKLYHAQFKNVDY